MRENRTAERRPCAVLVNNDADLERLLTASLAPELDLHVASTLQQALDLLEGLRRVDLAFLDLELPDGNADELLARLARWPEAIRVLLASAVVDRNDLGSSDLGSSALGSSAPGSSPLASRAVDGSAHGRRLKHRHLVHLVVCKPPALPVVQALKSMVLDLPGA